MSTSMADRRTQKWRLPRPIGPHLCTTLLDGGKRAPWIALLFVLVGSFTAAHAQDDRFRAPGFVLALRAYHRVLKIARGFWTCADGHAAVIR